MLISKNSKVYLRIVFKEMAKEGIMKRERKGRKYTNLSSCSI
jgi:hypothetical protein